jgi:hypothetical protein
MQNDNFYVFNTMTHKYKGTLYEALIENKSNSFYKMNDEIQRGLYLFGARPVSNDWHQVQEIRDNADILISGCSMTVQGWWAIELAKKMNMNCNSIAFPGDSTIGQISEIFWYIKEVGAPKFIFALFPSFERFEVPFNEEWFDPKFNSSPDDAYIRTTHLQGDINESRYFKTPYNPTFVLPLEISHYYSSLMINALSELCKAKGIKFVWGTWDQRQHNILQNIRKKYPDYYDNMIDMEADLWDIDLKNNSSNYLDRNTKEKVFCHEDERAIRYADVFDFARDKDEVGANYAHFGFHRHLHIAEIFYSYYLRNWKE